MTDDRHLNKVRKLLALAENPAATPEEAAAFTEKAMLLMARHGIDDAMMATASQPGQVANRRLSIPAPYARDKATLAGAISAAMRCRAIQSASPRGLVVHIFGFESDVRSTETLFTSLLVQAAHELARTDVPEGDHPAAFRRSWWAGFAMAVHTRLQQASRVAEAEAARREQQSDGPSVALVLARQVDEIDDELAKAYPTVRRARARRLSGGGHAQGYQSGQRVDLGTSAKIAAHG